MKNKRFELKPSKTKSDFKLPDVLYLAKNDERYKLFKDELKNRGFAQSELWSFYSVISCFILPRLVAFRKDCPSCPMHLEHEDWITILDKMIYFFETSVEDNFIKRQDPKYMEGKELFCRYFEDLWY